ncbi:hypothetical protein HMPREF0063_11498 [Aeromicrobium marinum DSM 15272]|uniref:Uncharacterized protein n=1 Tax=Aeromicrobium marinum DSM 15272 TaxID=585531 RepID=E2SBT9_9ACTN|nr:hypothetical protein [Aeromicrobium marinum]EFQ83225.1 hypothetical protein HMPREF0063_11498 [Aeromicrobium marinum DSM 15272]
MTDRYPVPRAEKWYTHPATTVRGQFQRWPWSTALFYGALALFYGIGLWAGISALIYYVF